MKQLLTLLLAVSLLSISSAAFACDDTLVMLLTAKNPNSEFTKTIRSFTTSLTELGSGLKAHTRENFDPELEKVMTSWMDFTTRYMTNPPEEAKNDANWATKTAQTSKTIGEIRKLVLVGNFAEAHNQVLELSGKIGIFFEAIGITGEKQLFLSTSSNLTVLEQTVLNQNTDKALLVISSLTVNLDEFKKMIPTNASQTAMEIGSRLEELQTRVKTASDSKTLDSEVLELKAMFNELRSHILMKEWFPETLNSEQEKKE